MFQIGTYTFMFQLPIERYQVETTKIKEDFATLNPWLEQLEDCSNCNLEYKTKIVVKQEQNYKRPKV